MEIKRTGLDLAKYVFEVHAVDMTNRWCFAKRSGAMLLLRSLPSWSLASSVWKLAADRTTGHGF